MKITAKEVEEHFSNELEDYKDFSPSQFDSKGLNYDEVGKNSKVLFGQNRDSGALSVSNFEIALEKLGGESEFIKIFRFSHWACGWFEIMVSTEDCPLEIKEKIYEIFSSLKSYPVLDDEHFSEKQCEFSECEHLKQPYGECSGIEPDDDYFQCSECENYFLTSDEEKLCCEG